MSGFNKTLFSKFVCDLGRQNIEDQLVSPFLFGSKFTLRALYVCQLDAKFKLSSGLAGEAANSFLDFK